MPKMLCLPLPCRYALHSHSSESFCSKIGGIPVNYTSEENRGVASSMSSRRVSHLQPGKKSSGLSIKLIGRRRMNRIRAIAFDSSSIEEIVHNVTLMTANFAIIPSAIKLDGAILMSSVSSSFKLFSLCSFVVWLQKSGSLPETTPAVLSQVAFQVLIPCFLMTKAAGTLNGEQVGGLFLVPVIALFQVFLGAFLGKIACKLAYDVPEFSNNSKITQTEGPVSSVFTPSANHIASLVTSSIGLPPPPQGSLPPALIAPPGVGAAMSLSKKKQAVVTAACAFGNSLTLPLVFLAGVLGSLDTDRAAGYLALYMTGWSPALWSVGYSIISGGDDADSRDSSEDSKAGGVLGVWSCVKRAMNPPLYGVFFGLVIGATPLSHLFFPNASLPESAIGPLEAIGRLTSGLFGPAMEAASLLGSATVAVQTIVLASSLADSVPSSFKFGSSLQTFRDTLFSFFGTVAADPPAKIDLPALQPITVQPSEYLLRSAAAPGLSLFEQGGGGVQTLLPPVSADSPESSTFSTGAGPAAVQPEEAVPRVTRLLDGRAMWVIALVRFLALPLINTSLVLSLRAAHVIPSDPVLTLVLLAEAVMPPAQNLVLLSQLRPGTRQLAGELATLMLRSYAIAIIPVTLWIAVFLSLVPV